MLQIEIGDVVARLSYGGDVLFRVVRLYSEGSQQMALLRGVSLRLLADAPVADLVLVQSRDKASLPNLLRSTLERAFTLPMPATEDLTEVRLGTTDELDGGRDDQGEDLPFVKYPGRVLHLDGDQAYVEESTEYYRQLRVPAVVKRVPEERQPEVVQELLLEHRPDILVLTGHDGFLARRKDVKDLRNYRTSRYFISAVRTARRYEPNLDSLVIVAGGCQSNYEALLEAGANFASSPARIFVHCYDPILIAEKIAYTSVEQYVELRDVLSSTITGMDGIGGVQTRGKLRIGLPGRKRPNAS